MHFSQSSVSNSAKNGATFCRDSGVSVEEVEILKRLVSRLDAVVNKADDGFEIVGSSQPLVDVQRESKVEGTGSVDIGGICHLRSSQRLQPDEGGDRNSSIGNTSNCFEHVCAAAGVLVLPGTKRVMDLPTIELNALASKKQYKVLMFVYGKNDVRNHITLVASGAKTTILETSPISEPVDSVVICCTTMEQFFNKSNVWATHSYYASEGNDMSFGADTDHPAVAYAPRQPMGEPLSMAPQSVHGDSVGPGGSNISGGVVRSSRRVISSRVKAVGAGVQKNYRVSNVVQFNNLEEIYQDTISRDYAQEIIEDLFDTWGVPMEQPNAARFAEDLLWAFLIATTASNKADYTRSFLIPVEPIVRNGETTSELSVDMQIFSDLLASKYSVTRRQFARGVANDQRAFLKTEANAALLQQLSTRIGCEFQLSHLAFDGSTHCSGMTTREVNFTKTLESRALFERDDVIAEGASERLMQGFSGGIRSKVPR